MSRLARLRSWIRAAFRRPGLNREIRDELEFHVGRYAEDLRRQGVPPDEADRQARAALGSVEARREECRQSLGLRLIDEWRADVRYALRLLRRSPGFAAVAILSLGLAIGANTAIFSLVDAVLLKALPVADPDRLFFVDDTGGKSEGSNAPPYPCYEILRDRARGFSGLAMFSGRELWVTIDGVDEHMRAQYASGNYFDVLGVPAAYGRLLTPADDPHGGSGGPDGPVVVISHSFWKRRFAMSPSVLGKQIRLGTRAMTIVGVTPPEFFGLTVGAPIDLTIPVTVAGVDLSRTQSWWFSIVGRLADGAAVDEARVELDGLFQSYMQSVGVAADLRRHFDRIELVPAARGLHEVRRQFSAPLTIVMAIVGLVLIIGCANVASLLVARASAREDEMTLRLAIGAGRGRLIRQLLTEGTVVAAFGAGAGLLLAWWSVNLLVGMIGDARQHIVLDPKLDARVLGFTTVVTVLTGLLCSVAPALRATSVARANASDAGRRSLTRERRLLGRVLVVVQVTVSLALLTGAALFIRTLHNLQHVEAGFRADGVLAVPVEATFANPPPGSDLQAAKANVGQIWADLAERASRLPGVRSAAVSTLLPMSGPDRGVGLSVIGGPSIPDTERSIRLNQVSPGYFRTLGIALVTGRAFEDADASKGWRVAILNQTAARAHLGDASPLGRMVSFGSKSAPYEVVGVVQDTRYESLRIEAGRVVYLPIMQPLDAIRSAMLSVRADAGATTLVPALRDDVRRHIPGSHAKDAQVLEGLVAGSLLQERLVSMLASVFGLLALTLSSVGLYGLLSFSVVRRTRELGIRMAIGAQRREVVSLVLHEALVLVAAALVCGIVAVLVAARFVRAVLFDVAPSDPLAIASAAAILLISALAATYLPARRASRIDLIHALRRE